MSLFPDSIAFRKAVVVLVALLFSSCSTERPAFDFFPKNVDQAERLASALCSTAGFHDLEPGVDDEKSASFSCQRGELFVEVLAFFDAEEQRRITEACDAVGTVLKAGAHYLVLNLRGSAHGTDRAGIARFPGAYGKGVSQPKYEITETSSRAC
jgi:hypothetical protein